MRDRFIRLIYTLFLSPLSDFRFSHGADDLYGGAGKDVFVFTSARDSAGATANLDTIFDFTKDDRIDLSAIDANSKVSGHQEFAFIEARAFSGKAGELRYDRKSSDTYVYADINGDRNADFIIHLDDAVTMLKGYFTL